MWRAFLQMRQDIERAVENQLKEHGLSSADYGILVVLSEASDQVLRVGEVAERTDWESSRLAHQLRRMEQRGLVHRFSCPHDARGTMVELTAQGRATIEAAAPGHARTVRGAFVDLLDETEIATLTAVADRVHRTATAAEPAARPLS